MAQRLPVELVTLILDCAARKEIQGNRAAVVQLALVSRFVHRLVHPILHHTMVVTESNHARLTRMSRDATCAHVFRAVRRLLVVGYEQGPWLHDDALRALLTGVTTIDAPFSGLEKLAEADGFRPSHVAVRYSSLSGIGSLPATATSGITHLTGYFPGDSTLSAENVQYILTLLRALTHIAFELVEFEPEDGDPTVTDLSELEPVLRACLEPSHIRGIALRVAADWLDWWPSALEIAQNVRDPRVRVWRDGRQMASWAEEEAFAVADTWAGRDIWTEAQPVASWREPS